MRELGEALDRSVSMAQLLWLFALLALLSSYIGHIAKPADEVEPRAVILEALGIGLLFALYLGGQVR